METAPDHPAADPVTERPKRVIVIGAGIAGHAWIQGSLESGLRAVREIHEAPVV